MSKERSTPLRRTCPICGRKARDLGRTRDIPMCMACRLALLKAETVLWGLASYVEWRRRGPGGTSARAGGSRSAS